MSKTIELTKDEVIDVIEMGEYLKQGHWKHGRTEHYLFDRDGQKYKLIVSYHDSEGIMMYGATTTAVKVKPVEKTIIEWVEE
jgi:hypothetical protein